MLDSECKLVLGHNWLTQYNLLIDWVLSSITFRTSAQEMPTLSTPLVKPASTGLPEPSQPSQSEPGFAPSVPSVDSPGCTPLKAPLISMVNAIAFTHACKLEGSLQFQLQLHPLDTAKARSTSTASPPDLSSIPPEYCDFADVFSKTKASKLPPHCEHDLKIELEDGTSPPLGTIYSLSLVKLEALRTFINENLGTGFICPTASTHAAPVLFIKKKDGSL